MSPLRHRWMPLPTVPGKENGHGSLFLRTTTYNLAGGGGAGGMGTFALQKPDVQLSATRHPPPPTCVLEVCSAVEPPRGIPGTILSPLGGPQTSGASLGGVAPTSLPPLARGPGHSAPLGSLTASGHPGLGPSLVPLAPLAPLTPLAPLRSTSGSGQPSDRPLRQGPTVHPDMEPGEADTSALIVADPVPTGW